MIDVIEDLTFLEEGEYTMRTGRVNSIIGRLRDSPRTYLGAISEYINNELMYVESKKFKLYRKRTASEIIRSGFVTGCTDMGLVFVTLARGFGIPTRYVETFEKKWLLEKPDDSISSHVFADVNTNGIWSSYEPILGFRKNNRYYAYDNFYVEAGKGIDFSELFLRIQNSYASSPVSISSMMDLGRLGRSMMI